MVALVDGQPMCLGLRDFLHHFLEWRCDVITRRSAFKAKQYRTFPSASGLSSSCPRTTGMQLQSQLQLIKITINNNNYNYTPPKRTAARARP